MNSIKTALVVDDDPNTRLLLQKFLARSGFNVQTAEDGGQAVTLLDKNDFGVVMLDLMMPVLDGRGVLTYLKERKPQQIKRVVIVTAYPGQLSSAELGVRAVVSKPFTFEVLTDILERV